MNLSYYITENTITLLKTSEKFETIHALVEKAASLNFLARANTFEKAVIERENMISTGIGAGVAIPHAPAAKIDNYFIITGISQIPIAWNAIDGQPVRLIFLIGIPHHIFGQTEPTKRYLQIIARLMKMIKNEDRYRKLVTASSAEEACKIMNSP